MRSGKKDILGRLDADIIDSIIYNQALNSFRIQINGSLAQYGMVDGISDEFEDESGIDTVNSTNESYDSVNDLYKPTGSHTVTANGNAQLDTAQKKFGTAAGLFDGTGDYLSIPDSSDWDFGIDDFTIEFWMMSSDLSSRSIIYSMDTGSWGLSIESATSIRMWRQDSGGLDDAYFDFTVSSMSIDTWYHIAAVRNGNNLMLFLDGTKQGVNQDVTGKSFDRSVLLAIGAYYQSGSPSNYFTGWLEEMRISKGIARWIANFTPETSAYSADSYTKLLLHCDGIDASTTFTDDSNNNMTLQSNSNVASSQPDNVRIVLFEEDVDSITINTDLKAYVSRDDGTTWTQGTLVDKGDYDSSKQILAAEVDISGQPSGTNMKYKLESLNNKDLKIHGVGLHWE